jgi:hypothetical protein
MSLAQHIASTEGADREWLEPLIESEDVLRRVLSFDPLPPRLVEDQADHIPAYKISKARRTGERFVEEHSFSNLQCPSSSWITNSLLPNIPSNDCTFKSQTLQMFPGLILHSKSASALIVPEVSYTIQSK